MNSEYTLNLKEIKRILKKRRKLILIISLLAILGGGIFGLKPSKKDIETKVSIIVENPISKEEMIRGDYDYLRFINSKNIMGPTELAKSQKIMKKVIESVGEQYDFNQVKKKFVVTNNLDANMIDINVKGNDADKVNKMLDVYTEEFLKEAKNLYSSTKFTVLDKENIEPVKESVVLRCFNFAILGAVLGVFISLGLSFLLDMIDTTVKKEDELEVIGLKVLAVIPKYN